MPTTKCAGGGDSKYELSIAHLVHVIKMSAFKRYGGRLIVYFWPRKTSLNNNVLFTYCF